MIVVMALRLSLRERKLEATRRMSRIERLPPEVASRIAAGEVVERPASVVKELVENALDAGATRIEVEVRDGGLSLIRVSDNGTGIPRGDVALAFERFATSKIRTFDDLKTLRTFGFRGEALPAIAAVAEVELLTRTADEVEGTRAISRPGQGLEVMPAAAAVGTQVTVRQLFRHLPARRKFLKSPLRETDLVQQTVIRYALAFPEVAFRLLVNGRVVLDLPPTTARQRIGQVLGRDIAEHLVEVRWEAADLRITGWVSTPHVGRATRSGQFFTVNRRPVRSGLLAVMLERPYAGRLPPGRKPIAVVEITIDPHWVDVNVHPQKVEVRFAQERSVYWALQQAVEGALAAYPAGEPTPAWPTPPAEEVRVASQEVAEKPPAYVAGRPRVLGQFLRTYILAENEDVLVLVDQHAAAEQVLYERIQAESGEPLYLSPPVVVRLTPYEADRLVELAGTLAELGLRVEPFGGHTFALRAVPRPVAEAKPDLKQPDVAQSFLAALLEEAHAYGRRSPDVLRERLAARMACFAAVKAGEPLTPEAQQALVDALWEAWSPATCPHGRPAYIILSREELERRFQRR